MNDELRDALNLDNWTATDGAGSTQAVICPHCGEKFSPEALRGLGLYYCGQCRRPFDVQVVDSPLGKAWITQSLVETPSGMRLLASSGFPRV